MLNVKIEPAKFVSNLSTNSCVDFQAQVAPVAFKRVDATKDRQLLVVYLFLTFSLKGAIVERPNTKLMER